MLRWTDDHCHLPAGDDAEAVVADAAAAGVERLITVGTDLATSTEAVRAATRFFDQVWATAGVHPHDASGGLDGIEALLADPACVAVGECGLDFHYDHSPRDVQQRVFAAQIELANRHDLALVIHTREAWDETFAVLDDVGTPARTVFHCFTGGPAEAEQCLERGAFLSFSGIVSFKTAVDIRAAAHTCPADRLLVETDSPYLAPVPHRGKPNRPAWVSVVGAVVAEVRGESVDTVAAQTWRNAERLYRLPESA